jgi:hypothetical protein
MSTPFAYAHKKTVRYYDYGSFLCTVEGLAWSSDGNPDNATGFEHGDFAELLAKKRAVIAEHNAKLAIEGKPSDITIGIGPDVARSCDMNPHGLM